MTDAVEITGAVRAAGRIEGAGGGGEIGRICLPCHVRVTSEVYGDAVPDVIAATTEEGGVDERRAVAIQLRHEGVGAASQARLDGDREAPHRPWGTPRRRRCRDAGGDGEVVGRRPSPHVRHPPASATHTEPFPFPLP